MLLAPPEPAWRFVDEAEFTGRSLLTYRALELCAQPVFTVHPDDRPPAGAVFSVLALGPGGKTRLGLVWHAASDVLWLDADGDGRFAPHERHKLGQGLLPIRVAIPFGAGRSHDRTVLVRRRGDRLSYAVRGFTTGTVTVDGKPIAALLVDGNADGCFDGAGADRIWLDLDGDGRFDPFTEQFPIGAALKISGSTVLVRPDADGLAVEVRERPKVSGSLLVRLDRIAGAEVVDVEAQYVSEFGELVIVQQADRPTATPIGRYRLNSLSFTLADDQGQIWRYSLASGRQSWTVSIREKQLAAHAPLTGLQLDLEVEAQSGRTIVVQPSVNAGPLYMVRCERRPKHGDDWRDVTAEILLCDASDAVVSRGSTGFQ
jgi:hypothetical protein